MEEQAVGRVVVGVDSSLAGLRALREAVDLARRCGVELCAVRVYHSACVYADWSNAGLGLYSVPTPPETEAVLKRQAAAAVARAFDDAMGGVPRDPRVRVVLLAGPLSRALVDEACLDTDLLVVAGSARRRRPWGLRGSAARSCVTRSVCPVLVVPPPPVALDLDRLWTPWRRRQRRRELDGLLNEPAS